MPTYNLTLRVTSRHTAQNIEASSLNEAIDILYHRFENNEEFLSFEVTDFDEILPAPSYTSMTSLLLQNSQTPQQSNSYTPMTSFQQSSPAVVSGYTRFSRN
jgi:hypothetical protein